jgi:hypothetical protein
MSVEPSRPLIFPKWVDSLRPALLLVLGGAPIYGLVLLYFGASPRTLNVGYRPEQPVPYSHALHAGELGIDCRYCHTTVERTAGASLPPTQTCMNCHNSIYPDSEKLQAVRESFESGLSIPWVRVHDLPDYAFFNHSAHVRRGVGCVACHGRVDTMEVVYQAEQLTMGWCLDCHRNPDRHLRPPELVTDMDWQRGPEGAEAVGRRIREQLQLAPSEDCSVCHR